MDYAKINEMAVKSMINGTKWGTAVPDCWVRDGEFLFVTFDGYVGYFLPKVMIKFKTHDVKEIENPTFLNMDVISDPENEIHETSMYVKTHYTDMLHVFKRNKQKTYINEKFLKPLSKECGVRYFQAPSKEPCNRNPVYAVNSNDVPLMMILPVNVRDDEFD